MNKLGTDTFSACLAEGLAKAGVPAKLWRQTSAERLGFDKARHMNIYRHSLSWFPATVAQLGRLAAQDSCCL